MKKHPLFTVLVRTVLSFAVLAQAGIAQQDIDAALQQKAKLLSPQLAQEIALQKEEQRAQSEEYTAEAVKLYDTGEYKKCHVAATEAVKLDPNNLTAQHLLARVNDILYDVYAGYAQARMEVKDYEAAITWYRTALEHKPKGEEALKGIQRARELLEASVSKNIGKIISSDMSSDEQVALLIKQARDLEVQSRYEEAKAAYKLAISIETENPRPRRLLKDLIDKQGRIIADDRRIERRRIIEEMIRAFFQYPDESVTVTAGPQERGETPAAQRRAEIIRKAATVLEQVSFSDARIEDIVSYVSEQSGVNIVLSIGEADVGPIGFVLARNTALDIIAYICEREGLTYTIDEYAIIISKGEGDMETRFWTISPEGMSTAAERAEETKPGAADTFDLFAEDTGAQATAFATQTVDPEIVRIIKESVPQQEGSSVYLEPSSGTLVARNTPKNLEDIDAIVRNIEEGKERLEVQIQTRFVQISDSDLEEWSLGMALRSPWAVGTETSSQGEVTSGALINPVDLTGALRKYSTGERNSRYADRLNSALRMVGVRKGNNQITDQILGFFTSALTDPEVGIVWHALSNKTNADILSAPSVTTVSGQQRVSIRQITEVLYPEEYTVYKPAIIYASGNVSLLGIGGTISGIAASYPGYATVESTLKEDIGIELVVTPTIGSDGRSVSMELTTKVSRETEPHTVIVYTGSDTGTTPIPALSLDVPKFKFQEVKTQVVVNDGETIILGGMVTEALRQYSDKVPFFGDLPLVGRFFRSEGSYQEKRNLLIFVTTRIITPTGESYKDVRDRQAKLAATAAESAEPEGTEAVLDGAAVPADESAVPAEPMEPAEPATPAEPAGDSLFPVSEPEATE